MKFVLVEHCTKQKYNKYEEVNLNLNLKMVIKNKSKKNMSLILESSAVQSAYP